MYVGGGGMSLRDRDYYLKDDARNKEVREAFKKLVVTQMQNAGYSKKDAQRIMKNVMKVETALADSALTREESRNITALYIVLRNSPRTDFYPYPAVPFHPSTSGFQNKMSWLC